LLDLRRVALVIDLDNKQLQQYNFSQQQMKLMKELQTMEESLYNRSLLHGYWDTMFNTTGIHPDTREGCGMAIVRNNLYIFGGFARELYNDMRVLNLGTRYWSQITYTSEFVPKSRARFSMNVFEDSLVLFGGEGETLINTNQKECFGNIAIFNTKTRAWKKHEPPQYAPIRKRCGHVAGMYGSVLLVYGGKDTMARTVLGDFFAFDLNDEKFV
jgi:N-acetylneuraminic acid mutarotase